MKHPSNNLIHLAALSLISLILTGCASHREPKMFYTPLPPVWQPPGNREAVWLPDQIAPYTVGRYVDPRDAHVVHEAHIIYRREKASRPNLTPASTLIFPPTAAAPVTNLTAMLRDALTAEVNQQRATSQALIEQARGLDQHLRRLNAQTQDFRVALQEAHRLREQLAVVSNRLDAVEGQLRHASDIPMIPVPRNHAFTKPASRP